jgi:hypothetical protein
MGFFSRYGNQQIPVDFTIVSEVPIMGFFPPFDDLWIYGFATVELHHFRGGNEGM